MQVAKDNDERIDTLENVEHVGVAVPVTMSTDNEKLEIVEEKNGCCKKSFCICSCRCCCCWVFTFIILLLLTITGLYVYSLQINMEPTDPPKAEPSFTLGLKTSVGNLREFLLTPNLTKKLEEDLTETFKGYSTNPEGVYGIQMVVAIEGTSDGSSDLITERYNPHKDKLCEPGCTPGECVERCFSFSGDAPGDCGSRSQDPCTKFTTSNYHRRLSDINDYVEAETGLAAEGTRSSDEAKQWKAVILLRLIFVGCANSNPDLHDFNNSDVYVPLPATSVKECYENLIDPKNPNRVDLTKTGFLFNPTNAENNRYEGQPKVEELTVENADFNIILLTELGLSGECESMLKTIMGLNASIVRSQVNNYIPKLAQSITTHQKLAFTVHDLGIHKSGVFWIQIKVSGWRENVYSLQCFVEGQVAGQLQKADERVKEVLGSTCSITTKAFSPYRWYLFHKWTGGTTWRKGKQYIPIYNRADYSTIRSGFVYEHYEKQNTQNVASVRSLLLGATPSETMKAFNLTTLHHLLVMGPGGGHEDNYDQAYNIAEKIIAPLPKVYVYTGTTYKLTGVRNQQSSSFYGDYSFNDILNCFPNLDYYKASTVVSGNQMYCGLEFPADFNTAVDPKFSYSNNPPLVKQCSQYTDHRILPNFGDLLDKSNIFDLERDGVKYYSQRISPSNFNCPSNFCINPWHGGIVEKKYNLNP